VKKIEAIISPHQLDELREALGDLAVTGMTVTEVRGFAPTRAGAKLFRGGEYDMEFVPKLLVETVVPDGKADEALKVMKRSTRTKKPGGGEVFVSIIERAVRIRTEETGEMAI
jgi:nitrogen regulatory protein P-II 1